MAAQWLKEYNTYFLCLVSNYISIVKFFVTIRYVIRKIGWSFCLAIETNESELKDQRILYIV